MERRELKGIERRLRSCGHPEDWTLDLKELDGTIVSYCMGCVVERLGLKPVARHRLEVGRDGTARLVPLELKR